MFITLTNANGQYAGEPVVLNTEFIVSVFRETVLKGALNEAHITCIYCPPHGTWQVQESLEEVLALLNK